VGVWSIKWQCGTVVMGTSVMGTVMMGTVVMGTSVMGTLDTMVKDRGLKSDRTGLEFLLHFFPS
jgi:hypothetical protein